MSWRQIRRYVGGLAKGLQHMHARNVAHHDLKAENVLLVAGLLANGVVGHVAKLADLGMAGPLAQTRKQAGR
jgi:serine/threonine protein kinase